MIKNIQIRSCRNKRSCFYHGAPVNGDDGILLQGRFTHSSVFKFFLLSFIDHCYFRQKMGIIGWVIRSKPTNVVIFVFVSKPLLISFSVLRYV